MSVGPLHALADDENGEFRQSVVLRRAVSQDRRLFEWYREAAQEKARDYSLSVVQLDAPDGVAVNIWRFERARPVRWTGPHFDALANAIAMEELEVRYRSIAWRRSL